MKGQNSENMSQAESTALMNGLDKILQNAMKA